MARCTVCEKHLPRPDNAVCSECERKPPTNILRPIRTGEPVMNAILDMDTATFALLVVALDRKEKTAA